MKLKKKLKMSKLPTVETGGDGDKDDGVGWRR